MPSASAHRFFGIAQSLSASGTKKGLGLRKREVRLLPTNRPGTCPSIPRRLSKPSINASPGGLRFALVRLRVVNRYSPYSWYICTTVPRREQGAFSREGVADSFGNAGPEEKDVIFSAGLCRLTASHSCGRPLAVARLVNLWHTR